MHDGVTRRTRWVGFAGLQQTTVERLMREDAHGNENARTTERASDATLADARHVWGGECSHMSIEEEVREAARVVHGMQRMVAAAGGRSSSLMQQLTLCHTYLSAGPEQRRMQGPEAWDALMRLIAGDVDAPDWSLTYEGEGDAETQARDALADRLAKAIIAAGEWPVAAQAHWQRQAAREMAWREGVDGARETLRVCIRAWRELSDGTRAGTAAWEQRWARSLVGSGECALASRLVFGVRAARIRAPEGGMVRVLMEWMRLVRAGVVRETRRRSVAWRAIDTAWRSRLAHVGFEGGLPHSYSPQFSWGCEQVIMQERGVGSGAAAVLARRRKRPSDMARSVDASLGAGASGRKRVAVVCTGARVGTGAAHAAVATQCGESARDRSDGAAEGDAVRDVTASRAVTDTPNLCTENVFACEVSPTMHAPARGGCGVARERVMTTGRRRTDAVLALTAEAYEAFAQRLRGWSAERQEGGRMAHARRRRGDG